VRDPRYNNVDMLKINRIKLMTIRNITQCEEREREAQEALEQAYHRKDEHPLGEWIN
jgi:hypothetical protein